MTDPRFALHWQMSRPERLAMVAILQEVKPNLALEIGTYEGGSLQVLSEYSRKVVSLDVNEWVSQKLAGRFANVEFRTGDSAVLLPEIVAAMNASGETPEFVLVDGAHSTDGVKSDINALLRLKPARELVILLHDSFNPACRRGMLEAGWSDSPYVHEVEIDFIPGVLNSRAFDTAQAGSMWSGLACAIMKPEPRVGELTVLESNREMFAAVYEVSIHAAEARSKQRAAQPSMMRRARTLAGWIKRGLLSST